MTARRTADAATVSTAAMANRADTPERWSICGASRTARAKRPTTSSRCEGTSGAACGESSHSTAAS
jgi:hypothetical protein